MLSMLFKSHYVTRSNEQTFLKGEKRMRKNILCLLAILALVVVPALAANPVVVAGDGSGDFLTIQAAISSWCAGGTNASATAPFVIRIKPGSYEEKISLRDTDIGKGDIVGDLKIQAFDTANKPIIKVMSAQTTMSLGTASRQGIYLYQSVANVEVRDIVFTYSLISVADWGSGPGAVGPINSYLIKIDETSANLTSNTVAFYNCVFTAVDTIGNPLVTSKAEALAGNKWAAKAPAVPGSVMVQEYGDVGESMSGIYDNCVFYGSASYGLTARTEGSVPETIIINNCLYKDLGFYSGQAGGANPNGKVIYTGTKEAKFGDLYNSTVILNTGINGGGGHLMSFSGASSNVEIYNTIAMSTQLNVRGLSGANTYLKVKNSLFVWNNLGIVHNSTNGRTFTAESSTFLSYMPNTTLPSSGGLYYAVTASPNATSGLISFKDCITGGGPGYKIGGGYNFSAVSAYLSLSYTAFPTVGANSITRIGNITDGGTVVWGVDTAQTNLTTCVFDDPMFASLDPTSPDFLDVTNTAYLTKASNGGALVGGGNFKSAVGIAAPSAVTLGQSISISALNGVAPFTWTSSDTTKGTITGTGSTVTFNAIALGSTLVTVTDSASGSASQTINIVATEAPLATELFE